MQGTLQKRRADYEWMRIGFATNAFATRLKLGCGLALVLLAIWTYLELPATPMRLAYFVLLYVAAALAYMNFGVWLHEQLHCLAFYGADPPLPTHIVYERKQLFYLNGYYSVRGGFGYGTARRALLGPLNSSIALTVAGVLGDLVLPGWWLPLMLSLAVVSLADMTHDLYMYSQMRLIGDKAKYWDRGRVTEVVWKA